MSTVREYKALLGKANELKKAIIAEIIEELSHIPDVPGYKPVGSGIVAFTVQASALSSACWAPEYYNNRKTAQMIAEDLQKKDTMEDVSKYLNGICSGKNPDIRANPLFIEELRKIMEKYELETV